MRSQNLRLGFLSLLLTFTHNPDFVYARVPIYHKDALGLVARNPKGNGGISARKITYTPGPIPNEDLPEWFIKDLKKISVREPRIKGSKEFIDLSKTGAQFYGIAGRAKAEEISIHVDDADLITDSNNYRWGGDITDPDSMLLATHMVSADTRYSAIASMYRAATGGYQLVDDFSQVTLYNPKGSAESPYKFLVSRANKMIIIERYRPEDDIAIQPLNFGDIVFLAWSQYAKHKANNGMAKGDINWIGFVDLEDKAQKFIVEGYEAMKASNPNVQLSKPGHDRLILSRITDYSPGEEEGEEDDLTPVPEGSPAGGADEDQDYEELDDFVEEPENDPEGDENPNKNPPERPRQGADLEEEDLGADGKPSGDDLRNPKQDLEEDLGAGRKPQENPPKPPVQSTDPAGDKVAKEMLQAIESNPVVEDGPEPTYTGGSKPPHPQQTAAPSSVREPKETPVETPKPTKPNLNPEDDKVAKEMLQAIESNPVPEGPEPTYTTGSKPAKSAPPAPESTPAPESVAKPSKKKRQAPTSGEDEIEADVYNAFIAIPCVRELTFMCVQKRAQMDHSSVNLVLTQPNRRSEDDSAADIQMLIRISPE
ncbi:hypothetical protein TWF730_004924 [Orbilia blumenaviensis]|uniref:Uncharacterized protein n=1 Tax=Orbilia blumenaviensis TaxID=1796055 RepID=A0AAV9VGQ0_9PEZI